MKKLLLGTFEENIEILGPFHVFSVHFVFFQLQNCVDFWLSQKFKGVLASKKFPGGGTPMTPRADVCTWIVSMNALVYYHIPFARNLDMAYM